MNQVILIGRMTKDAELKYIPDIGTPVATFYIAIDRDYKNPKGETPTDFIPVEVIGKSAEFVAKYLGKGRLIALKGTIRVEQYEKYDEKRTYTKVNTNAVKALDFKKDENKSTGYNPDERVEPTFEPTDDDDIPF